jgi:uncharacterized membrane protein
MEIISSIIGLVVLALGIFVFINLIRVKSKKVVFLTSLGLLMMLAGNYLPGFIRKNFKIIPEDYDRLRDFSEVILFQGGFAILVLALFFFTLEFRKNKHLTRPSRGISSRSAPRNPSR